MVEIGREIAESGWQWKQVRTDVVQSALTEKGVDTASDIGTMTAVIIIIQIELTSY